jgi:hypothetical protein
MGGGVKLLDGLAGSTVIAIPVPSLEVVARE